MTKYYEWKTKTFSTSRKAKTWAYYNKARVVYREGKKVTYRVLLVKES